VILNSFLSLNRILDRPSCRKIFIAVSNEIIPLKTHLARVERGVNT